MGTSYIQCQQGGKKKKKKKKKKLEYVSVY
jgi:hypothetical protein